LLKTNMFNYVKYKQMSFVSNCGKFKLYTVPNGLLFSTPPQPRFSFERMILLFPFFLPVIICGFQVMIICIAQVTNRETNHQNYSYRYSFLNLLQNSETSSFLKSSFFLHFDNTPFLSVSSIFK
jgi:hypothetical protein